MAVPESSDAFVFLGATGDLAYKQIFTAQALIRDGHLDMPIIGMARHDRTLDKLRDRARDSLERNGGVDADAFAKLSGRLQYVGGDYQEPATHERLRQALRGRRVRCSIWLFLRACSLPWCRGLAKAGCAKRRAGRPRSGFDAWREAALVPRHAGARSKAGGARSVSRLPR